MKKGAIRKPSAEKSSKSRPLSPLSNTELQESTGEPFSSAELPLARHDSPLGQLGPIHHNEISKGISNSFQWVRRAAGISQSEEVKTESKMAECGTDGNNPASVENCSHNVLRKQVPGFPLNCAFYRMAALFNSAPTEGGNGPCWNECVCCEDGVDLPEKVGNSLDMKVLVPTTPLELLRASEKWRRDLEQLDLEAPLLSRETNWDAIREVHCMLKNILTILEARDNEVNNKYELYRTSTEFNGDDVYDPEDSNDKDLYEALYKSFEEVSSVASKRCFEALNLTINCISESQDITNVSSVCLLATAIDLVEMYGRIRRVQEFLALNEEKTIDSTKENSEQEEERAFDCACRLIGAFSGYVILVQNHVLHLDLMQQDGAGTSREENSVVKCLQQSWTWLNKLGKQVALLCPNKKQKLFVYLLKTFIDALGELSQHQKLLSVLYDENCQGHVATACFCQKILLHSLMQLFKNAEKAGLEFRKDGLASAFDFAQTAEASRIYPVTLTLLLSLIAEQEGTPILQSQHFSETLQRYREELMSFAKPCVAVTEHLAREYVSRTSKISESAGDVIDDQDNEDRKLLEPIGLCAEAGTTVESPGVAIDDDEERVHGSSTSTNSEEAARAVQTSSSASSGRKTRISAFGNHSSHPPNDSSNNALDSEDSNTSASNTIDPSKVVDASSNKADNSLDRQLPEMPSTSRFDRVNINAITEVRILGAGSSGQVSLVMFDNTYVALKISIFPDPIKARGRLERECKVHQRINSHPNILRFLGRAVQTDERGEDHIIGIITDFCEFGDLREAIEQAASIQECVRTQQDISNMKEDAGYQLYTDWVKRLEVVSGIAAGMVHMHKHHIVHRDLTSTNVLLDNVDKTGSIGVKVCDFERGYYIEEGESIQRTRAAANSVPWMGPEVLKNEKYNLAADVYSIGTILWELMFLENPWAHLRRKCFGADENTIHYYLSTGKVSLSMSEDDAPEGVSEFPELVQLVKHAWASVPGNRPTMIEFYKAIRDICTRMKERLSAQEVNVKESLPEHDTNCRLCVTEPEAI